MMPMILNFTDGNDRYSVTAADDYQLTFLRGDDWLAVRTGTVTASMGAGNDYVWLGGGSGTIYGQDGNDRFDIRDSGWTVNGGADNDLFRIFAGNGHELVGAAGNDRFYFYADSSGVHASAGDGDDLFVGRGHAIAGALYGGAGNDRFVGFDHPAGEYLVLRGGTGDDVYRLESNLTVLVDERTDEGTDTILIAGGLDYTLGENVENLIALSSVGTNDPAILAGNALNNRIQGSIGFDTIYGGDGRDVLDGGAGNDIIDGGEGNDRIFGGLGADTMSGGEGADCFVFRSTAETPFDDTYIDIDWIADFDSSDRIDVSSIDADSTQDGFQHFTLQQGIGLEIGTLYVVIDDWGWCWVSGHTDEDGIPDVTLCITAIEGNAPVTFDSFIV